MTTTDRPLPGRAGGAARRRLLSSGRRPTRWDTLVTVLTLVTMLVAVILRAHEPRFPGTERLVFTLASWLPLLVRTRWPEPVLATVVAVEIGQLAVMHDLGADLPANLSVAAYQPVPVAAMLAVYTVAAGRRQPEGWLAGGITAGVLLAVALLRQPLSQQFSLVGADLVMVELLLVAAGVGVARRAREEKLARRTREAGQQARQAVLQERLRIARELHDTLAHDLALVDAQAGVADYLLDLDPDAARRALRGITQHTSAAIDELRATLVLLRGEPDEPDGPPDGPDHIDDAGDARPDHVGPPGLPGAGAPSVDVNSLSPVAGLGRLDSLLGRFRDAGVLVALRAEGSPVQLGHQCDLAAYRIIQEALTNATKHAAGAPVEITLRWARDRLHLDIHNTRSPRPEPTRRVGTGHGLIGLRERARAAGGVLRAGPADDGGYLVTAELPIRPRRTFDDSIATDDDGAADKTAAPETWESTS